MLFLSLAIGFVAHRTMFTVLEALFGGGEPRFNLFVQGIG
jgi:hypothetical protein